MKIFYQINISMIFFLHQISDFSTSNTSVGEDLLHHGPVPAVFLV